MVVPRESATALCRARPAGIEDLEQFDHLTMVKPASLQDTPHRSFQRHFMSCVSAALPSSAPPSEASTPDGQLMLRMLATLRNGLSDDSEPGRVAALSVVQTALYIPTTFAESYVIPLNPKEPSLVAKTFGLLAGRPFAVEFLNLFRPHPAGLSPAWVGRLGTLERLVPDGQLVELRRGWTSAGLMEPGDLVAALEPGDGGEQVFVIGGIQQSAAGDRQARIRGLLIVPPSPRVCV